MPKEQNVRHKLTDDEHAGTCSSSTANTQAAAAWSWFQHGGATTSKPEGARLAQRQQTGLKSAIVRPSRFKFEAENRMVSSTDQDSGCRQPPPDGANMESGTRRRHSFHQELLRPTLITSRFPSIDHEIKRCSCSSNCEASSLFDSFELEAVSKQLEQTLTGGRTAPIPTTIWEGRDHAGPSLSMDSHRADSDKVAGKRNQSGFRYKHEKHHHHHHALLHQFFHFRIPGPLCNYNSIANSNVNTHVHREAAEAGAPKKPRNKQSHDASLRQYSQKYSTEDINPDCNPISHPDAEHNSHKKVHKLPYVHATHFDDFYSKPFQPLIHLPQSLLILRHADGNSESRTNDHHHFHHHTHFHHHHHHLNRLHHHDAHQLHAAGLKLEQEIFYPQQRGVENRPPGSYRRW